MSRQQFCHWRNEAALSQKSAAQMLGITVPILMAYETGGFSVPKTIVKLCRNLEKLSAEETEE